MTPRGFQELAGGGITEVSVPGAARSEADCRRLWKLSEDLTGVHYPPGS
jgi:hypothetical protein